VEQELKKIAVAVMSFNRPQYLQPVLESLRRSVEKSSHDLPVYLFQDNAFNIRSNTQRAVDFDVKASRSIFAELFPRGVILDSPVNLGVALNYDRAEKFLFEKKGYDAVLFFEDDLVLCESYITVIIKMLAQAFISERVGMVCAYGSNHELPIEEQLANLDGVGIVSHSWGFGLTKRAYEVRKPYLSKYLSLLAEIDYYDKDRLTHQIFDLHNQLGFNHHVLSQDIFKYMALHKSGMVAVNTVPVLAHYIGKVGMHSSNESFEMHGYSRTKLLPFDTRLPNPDLTNSELVSKLYREQEQFILMSAPKR
jgi:hypothetical protein